MAHLHMLRHMRGFAPGSKGRNPRALQAHARVKTVAKRWANDRFCYLLDLNPDIPPPETTPTPSTTILHRETARTVARGGWSADRREFSTQCAASTVLALS